MLNLLTVGRIRAIQSFLNSIDQTESCFPKLTELLWDRGINIYQSEEIPQPASNGNRITQPPKLLKPKLVIRLNQGWTILEKCPKAIRTFLTDQITIIRSIDFLKIHYGSANWRIDLAKLMKIPLGEAKLNESQNLKPIQIN